MSWSVGFESDDGDNVDLGSFTSFSKGIMHLKRHVKNILDKMEPCHNLREEYITCLADIKDISDDRGIMSDSDQWEDMDFYVEDGHFYVFQD